MKDKGILINWSVQKGYGFIDCESYEDDVFIHMSALEHMVRKPSVGDVIFFDRLLDSNGKGRAEYATIKGVETKPHGGFAGNKNIPVINGNGRNSRPGVVLIIMGLVSVLYLYQTFSPEPLPISMPGTVKEFIKKEVSPTKLDNADFICHGKQHCSQMTSCKEAKFYLKNCPNVMIDGDADGIPCDRKLCGY